MAEIVVASGKGGVGKSTVSSSLSLIFRDHGVGIVDADAEAPNLHLLFDVKWKEEREFKSKSLAVIDYSKCTGCMLCKNVCTYEAIEGTSTPIIKEYICEGCNACGVVCPINAIKISQNNLSGWIKIGETEFSPFVMGEMDVGQANSGKLVTEVKNIGRSWVKDGKIRNLIVDSAAGIGCQVIASLGGANYAILVAEPTESSLSDLKRVYYLAQHFRIKSFIVVNKYNINPDFRGIEDFAMNEGLEIISKIPYDKNIPRSMAMRKTIIEYDKNSPASGEIFNIADKIEKILD